MKSKRRRRRNRGKAREEVFSSTLFFGGVETPIDIESIKRLPNVLDARLDEKDRSTVHVLMKGVIHEPLSSVSMSVRVE